MKMIILLNFKRRHRYPITYPFRSYGEGTGVVKKKGRKQLHGGGQKKGEIRANIPPTSISEERSWKESKGTKGGRKS